MFTTDDRIEEIVKKREEPKKSKEEPKPAEGDAKQAAELTNNSLYYYVREHSEVLIKEGHDIKRISDDGKLAQRLVIKGSPTYNLYRGQGYACVQRVLDICEKCSAGTSPLDIDTNVAAYYKEIYQDRQGNKTEVVLPFNRFGQCLTLLPLKLPVKDGHYCHDLVHNARDGKNILAELLQKKALTYFQMSEELHALWLDLSTEYYYGDAESYIARVEQYQRKMQALKPYSDLALPYDSTVFQERVDFLKTGEEARLALVQSYRNKCAIIIANIQALESAFDAVRKSSDKSLAARIQAYQYGDSLVHYIRDLTFFTSFQDTKNRANLDMAVARIDDKTLAENFLDLLDACFQAGDLGAFQSLLPHQGCRALTPDVLHNWHTTLVDDNIDNDMVKRRIAICQWLFNMSDDYRNFIPLDHMVIQFQDGRSSPLGIAIITGNFDAFSMLLQQGYSPDKEGILYQDQFIPIIKLVLMLEKREKFSQLLLDYQIPLDSHATTPHLPAVKNTLHIPDAVQQIIFRMGNWTRKFPSDLLVGREFDRKDVILVIQERTDVLHLAITLSHMVLNTDDVGFSQLTGLEKPGIICTDYMDNIVKNEKIYGEKFTPEMAKKYLTIVLHRDPRQDTDLDLAFNFIKMLSASLDAKFLENRDQNIYVSISRLAQKADALQSDSDPKVALCYYFACILLMNQKQELKKEEVHQVIQYYCKMAYLMQESEYTKSQLCFIMVRKLVERSPYIKHLSQTPEYQKAIITLTTVGIVPGFNHFNDKQSTKHSHLRPKKK